MKATYKQLGQSSTHSNSIISKDELLERIDTSRRLKRLFRPLGYFFAAIATLANAVDIFNVAQAIVVPVLGIQLGAGVLVFPIIAAVAVSLAYIYQEGFSVVSGIELIPGSFKRLLQSKPKVKRPLTRGQKWAWFTVEFLTSSLSFFVAAFWSLSVFVGTVALCQIIGFAGISALVVASLAALAQFYASYFQEGSNFIAKVRKWLEDWFGLSSNSKDSAAQASKKFSFKGIFKLKNVFRVLGVSFALIATIANAGDAFNIAQAIVSPFLFTGIDFGAGILTLSILAAVTVAVLFVFQEGVSVTEGAEKMPSFFARLVNWFKGKKAAKSSLSFKQKLACFAADFLTTSICLFISVFGALCVFVGMVAMAVAIGFSASALPVLIIAGITAVAQFLAVFFQEGSNLMRRVHADIEDKFNVARLRSSWAIVEKAAEQVKQNSYEFSTEASLPMSSALETTEPGFSEGEEEKETCRLLSNASPSPLPPLTMNEPAKGKIRRSMSVGGGLQVDTEYAQTLWGSMVHAPSRASIKSASSVSTLRTDDCSDLPATTPQDDDALPIFSPTPLSSY